MAETGKYDDFLESDAPWPGSANPAYTKYDNFLESDVSWEDAHKPQDAGEAGVLDRLGDTGLDFAKGIVDTGESAVGIGDLLTGNLIGSGLKKLGYDPEASRQFLSSGYSKERQQENADVQAAKGFLDTVIASVVNPAVTIGAVVESAPMMAESALAIRSLATKMLTKAGIKTAEEAAKFLNDPKIKTILAAAGGGSEGAMSAGQNQEQARQAGRSYAESAPFSIAAGLGDAAVSTLTGRIPGLRDVDTAIGTAGMGVKSALPAGQRLIRGAAQEGLEETLQSAQEQAFQNLSMGKPWNEGLSEAAAQGLLAGGLMGGGARLMEGRSEAAPLDQIAGTVESKLPPGEHAPAPANLPGDLIPTVTDEVKNIPTLTDTVSPQEIEDLQNGRRVPLKGALEGVTTSRLDMQPAAAPGSEIPYAEAPESGLSLVPTFKQDVLRNAVRQASGQPAQPDEAPDFLSAENRKWLEQASVSKKEKPPEEPAKAIEKQEAVKRIEHIPTNDEGFAAFPKESGTLEVPREDMPQIKSEARGAMVNFFKGRGIDSDHETVPASSLKPTQAEFSPEKVKQAIHHEGGDRSILVSSDNHIIDGHHQWMGAMASGTTDPSVDVIRIDAPIKEILQTIPEFPSANMEAAPEPTANQKIQEAQRKASTKAEKRRQVKPDDSLLTAIAKLGGISMDYRQDISGDTKPKFTQAGHVFTKNGAHPADMVKKLAAEGYFTQPEIESRKDNDGVNLLADRVKAELAGKKHYQTNSTKPIDDAIAAHEAEQQQIADQQLSAREAMYAEIAKEYGQETADAARQDDEAMLEYNGSLDQAIDDLQYSKIAQERENENANRDYATEAANAAQGNEPAREDTEKTGRREGSEAAPAPAFGLDQQTPEQVVAQEKTRIVAEKAQQEQAAKDKADAERDSFTLAGSTSKVDQAEARGQNNLFGANPARSELPLPEVTELPVEEVEPAPVPKAEKAADKAQLPPIVTASKPAYLKQMVKAAGLKKDSPGYDNAVKRIEDEYETELDKAYASLPFEQYNELNSEVPESLNRQAYDQLQKQYGGGKDEVLASQDYEGQHRPPGPDNGAPLHDLTGGGNIYPDDVYSNKAAQYYGSGEPSMDAPTISLAQSYKGRPNATVTIYRAIPDDLTNEAKLAKLEKQKAEYMRRNKVPEGENSKGFYERVTSEIERLKSLPEETDAKATINPGDWVSINRQYAKVHGESALRGNYKIISKKVKASEVFTNGDSIHEWGYWPKQEPAILQNKKFKRWFKESKVVNPDGTPKRMYRGDFRDIGNVLRVMGDGDMNDTSGGIYFTDDTEIASGYAKGKQSFEESEDAHDANKTILMRMNGKMKGLVDAGKVLPAETKKAIQKMVTSYGYNEEYGDYDYSGKDASVGIHTWNDYLQRARNNPLQAAYEILVNGAIMEPEEFVDGLKQFGISDSIHYLPVHEGQPNITPVYLSIQNPLEIGKASDAERAKVTTALRENGEYSGVADALDKYKDTPETVSNITPREMKILKDLGYDGIRDVGGSNTLGEPHDVWIAFKSNQIKSAIGNSGEFSTKDDSIVASQQDQPQGWLTAEPGEKGMSVEAVKTAVADAVAKLSQQLGVDVVVLNNTSELPSIGKDKPFRGAYSNGTVYLFADNIQSARGAQVVLAHELIGHKGVLEAATPEEWADIKTTIANLLQNNARFAKEIMAEVDRRYPEASEETKYKEFLALAAERREKRGTIGELVAKVKEILRRFLKSVGLRGPFSESELDIILSNSERYLKQSGAQQQSMDEALASSQEETDTEGQPLFSKSNNPSILASQGGSEFEEENGKINPELAKIANRVLASPAKKTLMDRVKETINKHGDDWQTWLKQGMVDQFASIADYEIKQHGQLQDASDSAYKSAAFSKNSQTVIDAAMNMGALKYKDGGIELAKDTKGLIQIFEPLAKAGLVREWELWAGAVRAKRLMAEGKEHNYTQADIDAVLGAVTGKKLAAFQKVQSEWTAFNKQMLDFAQESGLINGIERKLWERDDYVPFHRVSELADEPKPSGRKGGLSGQKSGIKQLKGGVEKISILESMVRNTAALIDSSMKNVAMQRTIKLAEKAGAVESVSDAKISDDEAKAKLDQAGIEYTPETLRAWKGLIEKYDARTGTVAVSVDGKAKRYIVNDPILLRAMTGLGPTGVEGIMKVLRIPKRLLTELVTADPSFSLRNLIRDTLSTWVTVHGVKRNPITDAVKNVINAYKENDTLRDMRAQGVGGGGFYDTSPEGARNHLERISGKGGVATSVAELWGAYKKVLGTTENANRMAVYDAAIKSGASKAEAAYQSMDVLNFSRHGEWKAVRMLIELVPFMNARVQGLDRLYRGAKEGTKEWQQFNKSFMLKGALLTAATLALLAANWDNDDYWDLEEWDRDTYYHFFVDGKHYRMPKPFEVGAIFSTIPERLFEQMRKDADTRLLGKRMLSMIANTFSFDPTPQFVAPALEVAANKSGFTGRPILSQGMQYASPEAQYTPYTSKTFIELADAMPDSAPAWMRSPARLEHLFNGYFGTLGGYVLLGSDYAVRQIAKSPVRPELRLQDVPVVQSFIRDGVSSNKQLGRVYDMSNEVDEIYSAIKKYREEGRADKAKELQEENHDKLATRKALNHATDKMSKIGSRIRKVYDNPAMTPAEKRKRIDELTEDRNKEAKVFEDRYRKYY